MLDTETVTHQRPASANGRITPDKAHMSGNLMTSEHVQPDIRREVIPVRDATPADIPAMLDMAESFIGAAWAHAGVPFSRDTAERLLLGLMANSLGILLITTDGKAMMGAVVYPWHFNDAVLTGQELFWWSGSPNGMVLLEEAERRAQALGATTFNMACMDGMRARALGRLYGRRGYEPNEHIFIKVLN